MLTKKNEASYVAKAICSCFCSGGCASCSCGTDLNNLYMQNDYKTTNSVDVNGEIGVQNRP